jgi:starch synthase
VKILFAASEAVPFIKTGGLGEVVGALASALKTAGHDVRLVLPHYRGLKRDIPSLTLLPLELKIPIGAGEIPMGVYEAVLAPRLKAYLVDSPAHFDREGIYGEPGGREFPDNDLRFILLSQAVLKIAKAVGFRPDVVHTHDWQTGLVPVFLKTLYRSDPFFKPTASVFSIHNIAYQGVFPKETLGAANLPWTNLPRKNSSFTIASTS